LKYEALSNSEIGR